MTAYEYGFISKCAEYGIDTGKAASMLKMAWPWSETPVQRQEREWKQFRDREISEQNARLTDWSKRTDSAIQKWDRDEAPKLQQSLAEAAGRGIGPGSETYRRYNAARNNGASPVAAYARSQRLSTDPARRRQISQAVDTAKHRQTAATWFTGLNPQEQRRVLNQNGFTGDHSAWKALGGRGQRDLIARAYAGANAQPAAAPVASTPTSSKSRPVASTPARRPPNTVSVTATRRPSV